MDKEILTKATNLQKNIDDLTKVIEAIGTHGLKEIRFVDNNSRCFNVPIVNSNLAEFLETERKNLEDSFDAL